ncbi:GntR family transcriptional regulator [Actinomycetospora sp. NBRC 106378]|uniref:GntR family transcriptional regulator n=1 Tax=Actinomycetospora sp. NBRC 106378 TaxID=3032208 RepID=UPI0024A4D703|nr:GntR family transcriptional regulator [Actinomycetospora sp. NBRC 106378]GLZ54313.1 GntR family transcriptional regulator [Actinomycetospora sp. NBRC 106378]
MKQIGPRHRSLREEVADELRSAVLSGDVEPGTHLTEQGVAERLGVSRLPVREAFRLLEAEGLLESLPRRGVRVVVPDDTEIAMVHDIRMALELLAVERTAQRADPGVFAELAAALDAGDRASADGRDDELSALNERFHDMLAAGTGSRVLATVLSSIRTQAQHLVGGRTAAAELSWEEHAAIVRAVLDQDGEMASMLMRRHLVARHAGRSGSGG